MQYAYYFDSELPQRQPSKHQCVAQIVAQNLAALKWVLIELNIPIYFCNKFPFLYIIGKINMWFNSYFIFLVGNPAIVEKGTKIGILKSRIEAESQSAVWAIFLIEKQT